MPVHFFDLLDNSRLKKTSAFLLSVLFLITAQTAKADLTADLSDGKTLQLLGIGMHQELRNDIYVGALFAPSSVSNVDEIKGETIPKRMSIRLVSNYSHRKMSRHWKERLAMNNPRNLWQPLTKEIVLFSRIFKRKLQVGDELNIDHVPGVGTQIYLNGTLFQTVQKAGFVDLLLNVWLGTNPPTKAFKKSIRGQDDAATKGGFVTKYSALQPIAGRFDADLAPVTQVAKAETPAKSAASKPPVRKNTPKKTTVAKPTPKKVAKTPPKTEPKKSNTSEAKPATTTPPPKKAVAAKSETNATEKKVAAQKPDFKPDININNVLNQAKPPVKKVASIEKTESAKQAEESIEEDFFDADLLSGSYTRDLINAIRKYESYPKKALQRGDQGDVVALVKIDGAGEIIDIQIVERSGSRILDKAVTRMVRKAAPFQAIPKELKMDEFEFEVPISFQL
ncbi:MAG: TonB family protein [Kangiellaceae bacterium]|nr:TonB family protein [Kangiellaceae bacterium]MCW9017355.1 TonB family protein [Kangiellaceae bacterium]